MKKFIMIMLMSLISMFLLSGCGETSTSTSETTVVQAGTQQVTNYSPPQVPTLQTN